MNETYCSTVKKNGYGHVNQLVIGTIDPDSVKKLVPNHRSVWSTAKWNFVYYSLINGRESYNTKYPFGQSSVFIKPSDIFKSKSAAERHAIRQLFKD